MMRNVEAALVHANILEPQRSTVLSIEPLLAVCKAACDASLTFGTVGAIEEGNVLVADVPEPMDLALILEQAKSNAMNGRVAPALVEEATGAIEVIEVVAVLLAAPEAQVADLEV